jgi:predicted CopG family antitoxin
MKAVTVHLDESVYRDFQRISQRTKRSTSELIREAMEAYRMNVLRKRPALWESVGEAASVGPVEVPWAGRGELLEGVFDRE